mmetsp:Transcript_127467/g.231766  ORF Transcript_127467/g.231766 Transcript_127467/m.231766 type:complete len:202 (-) Transcript_127467:54-659(-)
MAAAASGGHGGAEALDVLCEGLICEVCREQPAAHRLRQEKSIERSIADLRGILSEPLTSSERQVIEAELLDAERVLDEFRRHRAHTMFFKVVARKKQAGQYLEGQYVSVFDGETTYSLGIPSERAKGDGGCFVHTSWEHAAKSTGTFPRQSKAWGEQRVVLAVRGDGGFRFCHGKVLFDGITPLEELPSPSSQPCLMAWRW